MRQPELEVTEGREASSGLATLRGLLISMRLKQWTKNFLLYLALIFTVNLYWSPQDLAQLVGHLAVTTLAFVLFCLLSSAIYLVNDLVDLDRDRNHPVKRYRPLPSGRLKPGVAVAATVVLLVVAVPCSFLLNASFGFIALVYVAITLSYSFFLKHVVIIDVFTIAAGYVLRAVAGAAVIGVPVSPWLYVCTILGALFLGFSKRRHELTLLNDDATAHRAILAEYTPQLLDEILAVVTSSTVMAYSLYTFTAENLPRNHAMMLTIPFVLYGIFRYLYLVHRKNQGGSPEEVLLRDKPIIADIALWLFTVTAILFAYRGQ